MPQRVTPRVAVRRAICLAHRATRAALPVRVPGFTERGVDLLPAAANSRATNMTTTTHLARSLAMTLGLASPALAGDAKAPVARPAVPKADKPPPADLNLHG